VILAAIIGLPSLRLRGVYFGIGTLGLAIITRIIVGNIFPGVSFLPAEYLASFLAEKEGAYKVKIETLT
jgi:ABC-type branched-subunit amino acid transport system permease subunit